MGGADRDIIALMYDSATLREKIQLIELVSGDFLI
jgi:hypothetical protein